MKFEDIKKDMMLTHKETNEVFTVLHCNYRVAILNDYYLKSEWEDSKYISFFGNEADLFEEYKGED